MLKINYIEKDFYWHPSENNFVHPAIDACDLEIMYEELQTLLIYLKGYVNGLNGSQFHLS